MSPPYISKYQAINYEPLLERPDRRRQQAIKQQSTTRFQICQTLAVMLNITLTLIAAYLMLWGGSSFLYMKTNSDAKKLASFLFYISFIWLNNFYLVGLLLCCQSLIEAYYCSQAIGLLIISIYLAAFGTVNIPEADWIIFLIFGLFCLQTMVLYFAVEDLTEKKVEEEEEILEQEMV